MLSAYGWQSTALPIPKTARGASQKNMMMTVPRGIAAQFPVHQIPFPAEAQRRSGGYPTKVPHYPPYGPPTSMGGRSESPPHYYLDKPEYGFRSYPHPDAYYYDEDAYSDAEEHEKAYAASMRPTRSNSPTASRPPSRGHYSSVKSDSEEPTSRSPSRTSPQRPVMLGEAMSQATRKRSMSMHGSDSSDSGSSSSSSRRKSLMVPPGIEPSLSTRTVRFTENLVCPSPMISSKRRRGWYNRRGDQLWTNEGHYVPAEMEYPPDLDEYPEYGAGWMNEEGTRIDMEHRLIPKVPLRSALKKTGYSPPGPRIMI